MELKSLTSLRGIAALLVAWGHFHNEFPAPTRITLCVDLFFILSGFVIMLAYHDKVTGSVSYLRFLGLRLGRVYPVHLATLALALLAIGYVNFASGHPLFYARDTELGLLQNLFLVQAWPPLGAYSWNMPAWSISAEWAAYLLFPIALFLSNRLRLAFVLIVIAGYVAFWFYRDGGDFGAGWRFGVHRCLLGFALGVWLCSAFAAMGPTARKLMCNDVVGLIAIAGIAAVWLLGLSDWYVIVPMALLILCLAGNTGALNWLMRAPPLYGVGLISYSLYMVHYPIYKLWQHYYQMTFPDGMSQTNMAIAAAILPCIVMATAWACWALIEEPGRRASKALFAGKARAPVVAAPATPNVG